MNEQNISKEFRTDWARIDAMTDDEIDLTDIPEFTEEMWAKAVWRKGSKSNSTNSQETLAIDGDRYRVFQSSGARLSNEN